MNIYILDGHSMNPGDLEWTPLEELGKLTVFPRIKPIEVVEKAPDADIILTNKVPLGRDLLDLLTRVRYIGVLATGYNNIDVDYCKQLGIPVTNIPSYSRDSVVQTVLSFMLHFANRTWEYSRSIRDGEWERSEDFSYLLKSPMELAGKTLGIAGYGDIGSQLAVVAGAMGMKVIAALKPDGTKPRRLGTTAALPLNELVTQCDFLSLHMPLTKQTEGIINDELLQKARRGMFLINTARGAVVNNEAVVRALDSGMLAHYAADVFTSEPPSRINPIERELLHHDQSTFTPHIAWASIEARRRAINIAAQNIARWLEGSPENVVNGITRGN